MKTQIIFLIKIGLLLSIINFASIVKAGEILKVRDSFVLVQADDEVVSLNQKIYIESPDTERHVGIAIVRKKNPKDGTYTAEVVDGDAKAGMTTTLAAKRETANYADERAGIEPERPSKRSQRRPNENLDDPEGSSLNADSDEADMDGFTPRKRRSSYSRYNDREDDMGEKSLKSNKKIRFGIGAALVNSNLSVKTSSITTNMTGTGFSIKGHVLVHLGGKIQGILGLGLQPLNVTGSNSQGGTSEVNISYVSFDGMVRYFFGRRTMGLWAGVGGSFLSPSNKESNILTSESMSSNYTMNIGGGFDFKMGRSILSLKVEYGMLPSSSTSTTNSAGSQINVGAIYFF